MTEILAVAESGDDYLVVREPPGGSRDASKLRKEGALMMAGAAVMEWVASDKESARWLRRGASQSFDIMVDFFEVDLWCVTSCESDGSTL
jgi:hypothetical protein